MDGLSRKPRKNEILRNDLKIKINLTLERTVGSTTLSTIVLFNQALSCEALYDCLRLTGRNLGSLRICWGADAAEKHVTNLAISKEHI
jgi:hypothetical protein